jgi:hypothetical protein
MHVRRNARDKSATLPLLDAVDGTPREEIGKVMMVIRLGDIDVTTCLKISIRSSSDKPKRVGSFAVSHGREYRRFVILFPASG